MRKSTLKRTTPLKRHTTLKAKKGLNKISPKTAERNRLWHETENHCITAHAKGLCEIRATDECKARNFKPDWRGLSGHHIILRSKGRIDTEDNCLIGCGNCHDHRKYASTGGIPITVEEAQKIVEKRS